ncbi:VOC family protein [Microlunatus ginsengisoli]|uniref:VOC family protein n=1 Tax=Microlunatus ginsengisoli TaxID=363863 RepID=A0ABP7AQ22_9ACTN
MSESEGAVRLGSAVIDTDDPAGLAAFYAALLGWPVHRQEETWICLTGPGGLEIAFQFSIGHRPPTWPDPDVPQQLHLDFYVQDLPAAVERALDLGARTAGVPDDEQVVILVDPSGHPFCLCLAPERRQIP